MKQTALRDAKVALVVVAMVEVAVVVVAVRPRWCRSDYLQIPQPRGVSGRRVRVCG